MQTILNSEKGKGIYNKQYEVYLFFISVARYSACSFLSSVSLSLPICVTTRSTRLPDTFTVADTAGASSPRIESINHIYTVADTAGASSPRRESINHIHTVE